ncbi:DoxX family protein [Candidatus Woesearchaeota archaeon]|nr:DoxX family protein [Candidatus Woesearchaeota archaeon]MBT5739797.1 DoxX family protein [Candidatus Woesearchaeota archaeon]
MDTKKLKGYAPTVLRAGLGLLFLLPGIDKLIGMLSGGHMLAGMIGSGLTWIVLLAEIIFGVALLVGWKVKLTVWPLVIIMAVAIFMMVIPNFNLPNFMFHILAIAGLVSLYLSGEGAAAMKI